jgi:hypothetical protein
MNHEILLAKLHFCGIQGVSEDWFRSYLANSRQKVAVISPNSTQNVFSGWGTLQPGVPQGSILGPLLFIIYRVILKQGDALINTAFQICFRVRH